MNPRDPDDRSPTEAELLQRELTLLVAHDLRNPLAAVLANLSYLEMAPATQQPDLRDTVADIRLAAETLEHLVENLVAVAKLEVPRPGEQGKQSVALAGAVRAAVTRLAPSMQSSGVHVAVLLPEDEPLIAGDQRLVELLVENLVSNALRHLRKRQRATLSLAASGAEVALSLEDDGPPFGPPERDFSRAGQLELKKNSSGRYSRGLGLYVVGLITRALGGAVATQTVAGRASVTLTFPRVQP